VERFGAFDAVVSLGAFEHFCSPEDYRAGRQEDLYRSIFERVASVLPEGGRLYLQTMVYGRKMISPEEAVAALDQLPPRDTDAWYLALLSRQFPGSWLPWGQEQVVRCAAPAFRLLSERQRGAWTTSRRSRSGTRGSAGAACASRCSSWRSFRVS